MTTRERVYLSAAETAKHVRKALAAEFPGVKFSVRSSSYSGGASIDVSWTDGPRAADVEPVAKQYQGGGFDGMIDMMHYRSHWMRRDGRVIVRHASGTESSMGSVPGEDNRALEAVIPADAVEVHFGADFIFCERKISNREELTADALSWLRDHTMYEKHPTDAKLDRFGNSYLVNIARNMAGERVEGEDWETVFARRWY